MKTISRYLDSNPKNVKGTSLAVQWLRLCLSMHGVQVQSLARKLRPNVLCSKKQTKKQKPSIKQKQYCNKFNKKYDKQWSTLKKKSKEALVYNGILECKKK